MGTPKLYMNMVCLTEPFLLRVCPVRSSENKTAFKSQNMSILIINLQFVD